MNSVKRINACLAAGADSFDGTKAAKRSKYVRLLDHPRHQSTMFPTLDKETTP